MADAYRSAVNSANARIGWAVPPDKRRERTRPMRDGRVTRLREKILTDYPELAGNEAEIQRLVEAHLTAHLQRMRANSLKTRRANAAAKRQAAIDALASTIDETEAEDEAAPDAEPAA